MNKMFELSQFCYTCKYAKPYYNDPPEKQRRLCKCKINKQGDGVLAKVYNGSCEYYKMDEKIKEQIEQIQTKKMEQCKRSELRETLEILSKSNAPLTAKEATMSNKTNQNKCYVNFL